MNLWLCVLILFLCTNLIAQSNNQKTERSTYWQQRVTLFKSLPNDKNEIIFLGNSITDGGNWSELFNNVNVKNRGISADVTDGILERLDEVTESKPAKIFIMIGVNDLAFGVTVEQVLNNFQKIIERIQTVSKDTEIYIQSILPVNPDYPKFKNHTDKGEQILEVNANLKQLAKNKNVIFIDLYSLFAGPDNKLNPAYTNDGLHLTGSGYLVWKSAVQKYID